MAHKLTTQEAGEFELIRRYFTHNAPPQGVGVGDDCAILLLSGQTDLAISKDLLLEDRHFFSDMDPFALGHKSLAVNLSDLAAMAAEPIACLLGLAVPSVDHTWLQDFSAGFVQLATRYNCPLIGGDTTRSKNGIVISVTVLGRTQEPFPLRSAARPDDDIWVSGELGEADIALSLLFKQKNQSISASDLALLAKTRQALERPEPQVELALALRGKVNAMIDLSDGLLQDLLHILKASNCGAVIYESTLPVPAYLQELDQQRLRDALLGGGEVYQLCFTAPVQNRLDLMDVAERLGVRLSCIGSITKIDEVSSASDCSNIKVFDRNQKEIVDLPSGFDHFPQ